MFNFQQEIEDQLREIREQYGDEVLKEYLDQDYYDGEYCNPPLYRWSRSSDQLSVTVIKLSTRGWYLSGPWYYKV